MSKVKFNKTIIGILVALVAVLFFVFSSNKNLKAPDKNPTKNTANKLIKDPKKDLSSNDTDTDTVTDPKILEQQKKAQPFYSSAISAARAKDFRTASEELHNAFQHDETLIDQALNESAFKDLRDSNDFQKLLKIYGRDIYKDLGLPPIDLSNNQ